MTAKDFNAIARIMFDTTHGGAEPPNPVLLATMLADYFETTNPRFDRSRFLSACGQ